MKIFIQYVISFGLIIPGALMIKYGLSEKNFEQLMKLIHYKPTTNYGKRWFSVLFGILLVVLGMLFLPRK